MSKNEKTEEFKYCERIVKFFVEKHHDAREAENTQRQNWVVSDLLSFLLNHHHRLTDTELKAILKEIPKHILIALYKKAKKAGYASLMRDIEKELGYPLPLECENDDLSLV